MRCKQSISQLPYLIFYSHAIGTSRFIPPIVVMSYYHKTRSSVSFLRIQQIWNSHHNLSKNTPLLVSHGSVNCKQLHLTFFIKCITRFLSNNFLDIKKNLRENSPKNIKNVVSFSTTEIIVWFVLTWCTHKAKEKHSVKQYDCV